MDGAASFTAAVSASISMEDVGTTGTQIFGNGSAVGKLSGTTKWYLDNTGDATFTGTINGATVGTSDVRFKENIAPAQPQLDDVVALGGLLKNFDWNEDAPVNEEIRATRQLGLIAQEAEEVCPSLVKTIGDSESDDSYKAISHDALIMKLLGAVAELKQEVEDLRAQLDS